MEAVSRPSAGGAGSLTLMGRPVGIEVCSAFLRRRRSLCLSSFRWLTFYL